MEGTSLRIAASILMVCAGGSGFRIITPTHSESSGTIWRSCQGPLIGCRKSRASSQIGSVGDIRGWLSVDESPGTCSRLKSQGFEFPELKYEMGTVQAEDIPEVAALLVDAFFGYTINVTSDLLSTDDPTTESSDPNMQAALQRWHIAQKGLHWRLGNQLLEEAQIQDSTPSAMMLAVRQVQDSAIVGVAELSLQPRDGKLPGEFPVPPMFRLHSSTPLCAYLSNLAVTKRCRRQRIAASLINACEQIAQEQWVLSEMYLHVDIHNEAALTFYQGRGYKALPEYDTPPQPPISTKPPVLNRYHVKSLMTPPQPIKHGSCQADI